MKKIQKRAKNAQLGGKMRFTEGNLGPFSGQKWGQNRVFTEGNLGSKIGGYRGPLALKRPFWA